MNWIHNYQLFLFDFDGILVNTELLHYQAYKDVCSGYGFTLNWDLPTYIKHAMYDATGVKHGVYKALPSLEQIEPNWESIYQKKKQAYISLLEKKGVELIPGVQQLLEALRESNIKRCVVTHSPAEQTALICEQNPILKSIPHWITREDYKMPKPSPECYLQAIKKYAEEDDRIIGFEDSPRGLKALLGTKAEGVLISNYFPDEEIERISGEEDRLFAYSPSFPHFYNQFNHMRHV